MKTAQANGVQALKKTWGDKLTNWRETISYNGIAVLVGYDPVDKINYLWGITQSGKYINGGEALPVPSNI